MKNMKNNEKTQAFVLQPYPAAQGKKNQVTAFVVDLCFIWMYLAGLTIWLVSALNLSVNTGIVLLLAAGITVLWKLAAEVGKSKKWILFLVWGVLLVLTAAIGQKLWLGGMHQICNSAIDALGRRFPYLLPSYGVAVTDSMKVPALYGAIGWLLFLVVPGAGYLVEKGNRMFLGIQMAGLVLLQMITGVGPGLTGFLCSFFCFLAVWIRGHAERVTAGTQRLATVEMIVGVAVLGGILLTGGYAVIQGSATLGMLTAFLQYANNIVWPMENLGWLTNAVAAAFASNKKINKILAEEPQIKNRENAEELKDPQGNLRFDHVSFELHGTPILEDINFELEQGHTLGIMGMTGAGKSTIVSLINRFYDVNEGRILLDGRDIRELTLESVRGCTAVVTQDVFLFSDTIRENLKLGQRKSMSDDRVKQSLAAAHAQEFVEKLEDGYNTVIGERGVGLSGGQKQRLSIARALAKDAKILILDDSTSALDMETEYEIQKMLAEKKEMSKIIVAHRISSVRNADEIIVLSHGKIAERGRHEELLAKKGLYYATYEAQYGDYRKAKQERR